MLTLPLGPSSHQLKKGVTKAHDGFLDLNNKHLARFWFVLCSGALGCAEILCLTINSTRYWSPNSPLWQCEFMQSFCFAWIVQDMEGACSRPQLQAASWTQMSLSCASTFFCVVDVSEALWVWDIVECSRMRWGRQEGDIHTAAVLH